MPVTNERENDYDRDALMKELGAPQSTFDNFQTANKDADPEAQLRRAYSQFTGREADDAGLAAHLKNPGGAEGGVRAIYASPESQAYGRANPTAWGGMAPSPADIAAGRATDPATAGAAGPPATGGAAAPATGGAAGPPATGGATPPARTPVTASTFTGFQPKYAMEGFDTQREQNTGKSAKDAFAYLSNQAPPPPINDKAKLAEWFNEYIKPGMNELGHTITSVDGDKFGFQNWQGNFNVDYGRGAGAEGGALAWQVDDPSAKLSNGAYTPKAGPTGADIAGAAAMGGGGADNAQREALMKEIEALVSGGNSPMDQNALLEQLQAQP